MMRPTRRMRTPLLAGAALLVAGLSLGSCLLEPRDGFLVSGRLEQGFECLVLASRGRTYELTFWRDPIPPAGSVVTLRVRAVSGVSFCMVGPMVEVLKVVRVFTGFRTAPVARDETWGPDGKPIVLGRVEVIPGATLTILPGTVITITDYSELRVRGGLIMLGTPQDSIRVVDERSSLYGRGRGHVTIDSTAASVRMEYATLGSLTLHGAREVQHVRARHLTVAGGSSRLRDVAVSGLSAYGGHALAEDCDLGYVDALSGELTIHRSRVAQLSLSYSSAEVRDSHFEGDRSYVLFHGPSGGAFERNVFRAAETIIEVRHTSAPVFRANDFISPTTRIECGTFQLPTCVSMENNWWGTAGEDEIRAKIQNGCPVCYVPWRTAPMGAAAALP